MNTTRKSPNIAVTLPNGQPITYAQIAWGRACSPRTNTAHLVDAAIAVRDAAARLDNPTPEARHHAEIVYRLADWVAAGIRGMTVDESARVADLTADDIVRTIQSMAADAGAAEVIQ